ncbi:hypothetical protein HPP92_027946 [Vanilla planifolia]|uniref:Uncharacterized protein n=1 Tax=Vanilla planifolia TaxID=51239 RepID=A0A835QBT2_VANPL|nr:hypothetical protein HPP92_027946 [Vanilla planifolia]KAG0466739.1 hypothetical protein HPP92_018319 [Vanilla planifolia]
MYKDSLQFLCLDKNSPFPYEGARAASAIESLALDQLETNASPPQVSELFSPIYWIRRKREETDTSIYSFLLLRNFKTSPYGLTFCIQKYAGKQPDLEQKVGVGRYGYPALVALHVKKLAYAPLRSAFELNQIIDSVKEAGQGGKGNLPIDKAPSIVQTQPWDSNDGEAIEEDEFSLENLMGDDSVLKDEL